MSESSSQRPSLLRRALPWGAVFLVLWAVSLLVTNAVITRAGPLAPADGLVYADAFDRALAGQITVSGDKVGYAAAEQFMCGPQATDVIEKLVAVLGSDPMSQQGAPRPGAGFDCRAAARDLQMTSTAWIHPPTYFFLQAGATRAVTAVLPQADPFTVGRWLGTIWFAAGGVALVALGVCWGARRWPATLVVAAIAPMGAVTALFGYVTPDNAVLLVGALALLAVTAWWRGRIPAVVLGAVGLLCGGLIKQTFVLAGFTAGLMIITLWWSTRSRPEQLRSGRESVVALLWLGGGALLGVGAWQLLKGTLGTPIPDPPNNFLAAVGPEGVFDTVVGGLPTILRGTLTSSLEPRGLEEIAVAMSALVVAASVGLLIYRPLSDRLVPMVVAGVGAATVGFAALSIAYSPVIAGLLPPAPRYLMPALPALLVPLMVAASARWLAAVTGTLGLAGLLSWYLVAIV